MFPVGTEVSASHRWPYHACHSDCWLPPHKGTVLAQDDPRAWSETIAFPWPSPDQELVTKHVQRCKSEGLLDDRIPVLYKSSVDAGVFMCWEQVKDLKPYAEMLAIWEAARKPVAV